MDEKRALEWELWGAKTPEERRTIEWRIWLLEEQGHDLKGSLQILGLGLADLPVGSDPPLVTEQQAQT